MGPLEEGLREAAPLGELSWAHNSYMSLVGCIISDTYCVYVRKSIIRALQPRIYTRTRGGVCVSMQVPIVEISSDNDELFVGASNEEKRKTPLVEKLWHTRGNEIDADNDHEGCEEIPPTMVGAGWGPRGLAKRGVALYKDVSVRWKSDGEVPESCPRKVLSKTLVVGSDAFPLQQEHVQRLGRFWGETFTFCSFVAGNEFVGGWGPSIWGLARVRAGTDNLVQILNSSLLGR